VKQERLSLTERMQRIRKTDTKPEMIVRRLIHALGYRYRLHQSNLPGTPDIVFSRCRKVILVHGCFWHRHDCSDGRKLPRSKPEYWRPKLDHNRRRDEACVARLHELGWGVLAWARPAPGAALLGQHDRGVVFLPLRTSHGKSV
jgi:DNA mismatch endonuclease (patch repair protein)